ncbi:cytochrome-c peroxidase [Gemmatimonadetes bacterium T265]|nr:cytochrome-c peroxidase [Gemmatimonadetes bacterium T265]
MFRPTRPARAAGALLLGACLGAGGWTAARPHPRRDPARLTHRSVAVAGAPLWSVDAALSARLRGRVAGGLDTLDAALARLARAAAPAARRAAYRDARHAYKRLEGVLAYFAPPVAAALDGTEAEEGDDNPDAGRVVAHGFARLEAHVFGATPAARHDAGAELARMRAAVAPFRAGLPYLAAADAQLVDVARLELARVSTLGIAGVDAGASPGAVAGATADAAAALDGARALVADVAAAAPAARADARSADARLAAAAAYLRAHPDFAAFDRFAFVTGYANPAFAALAALAARVPAPDVALRRAWPRTVASVYDARAFDALAYADADAPRPTAAWVALGRALFAEPALSGDGTRACASCHVPARGFTDGRARAAGLAGAGGRTLRHTPRLAYAAWQPAQFADARAATLEAQVDSVLASPAEMGGSAAAAAARLGRSAEYRRRFAVAEGLPADGLRADGLPAPAAVTPRAVRQALAAYVRSLGRFDSRFDRAVRGDAGAALAPDERRGFNLFMGRARCGTCHFAPLFNGTAPPDFARSDVEVVGVPERYARGGGGRTTRARVDPDSGRAARDHLDGHLHAFTTPSVRGAAAGAVLGGPFMHNGALRTLDDVLDFYDRGGGVGLGADVPNQTLPRDPLHLTGRDRRALVAFLRALADPPPAEPTAARAAVPTHPTVQPPVP